MLVATVGLAVVVGVDGTLWWQSARVALVLFAGAVLLGAADRGRGRAAQVAVFAAGALTLPVGIGIAVPHLSKGDVGLLAAGGVACLLGGLALTGVGGAALVRRSGRLARVLLIPVLLVVLAVPLLVVGVPVAVTNVPRTSLGSYTPADRGLAHEDVTLVTSDGVQLSAWYVPSRNGAGVVLLHGAGSTRSGVLDHAVALADLGYGALLLDARGHGRSAGRAMDFGWYGDADVAAAVDHLAGRTDVEPGRIAVVGMSMGGEEAIGAAASDRRIAAVVAEGATHRVHRDEAWLSEVHGWRGQVQESLEWLVYAATDLLTAADPPVALRDAVARSSAPMLLIAGGSMPDEVHAAAHIRAGAPDRVDVWVVPGAGHTEGLDRDRAAWTDRVTSFLEEALPQR